MRIIVVIAVDIMIQVVYKQPVQQAQKGERIIPTGQKMPWLQAVEAAGEKGLPSNVLHDETLVRSDVWKQLPEYYPAWAREVLVYPEKGGKFMRGEDVVDGYTDDKGRQWVFPASQIPEAAIGKNGIALFVNPQRVEVEGSKVTIIADPQSITVLDGFMQKSGWGKVDEKTRVPVSSHESLAYEQKRYLWRLDTAGVRPLVRGDYLIDSRRGVVANGRPDDRSGVAQAGSSLEEAAPKATAAAEQLKLLRAEKGEAIEVTLPTGQKLKLAEASAEVVKG